MNESPTAPKKRTASIVIAAVGLIAALGVIAVVTTRSKDSSKSASAEYTAPASEFGNVTASGSLLPEFAESPKDPAVGQAAPSLAGQSWSGEAVKIAPGKPTLVMFLAHWCPHCQREVPAVTKWAKEKGGLGDVDLVAVATSTKAEAPNFPPSKWLFESGLPARVILDDEAGTAAKAYGLSSFPYFVAIDAAGNVVSRTSGELSNEQLDALLAAAKADS